MKEIKRKYLRFYLAGSAARLLRGEGKDLDDLGNDLVRQIKESDPATPIDIHALALGMEGKLEVPSSRVRSHWLKEYARVIDREAADGEEAYAAFLQGRVDATLCALEQMVFSDLVEVMEIA